MSLNDVMTPLMDKARKLTGLTEKISVPRLTGLMDHFDLHVNPNLLSKSEWDILPNPNYPTWSTTQIYPKLEAKVYTLSWRAKTSGKSKTVRVRIFDDKRDAMAPGTYTDHGGMAFPLTSAKTSFTFTVPDDGYDYGVQIYGSGTNIAQIALVQFYDCKLEVGDLATPLEKVGGGS